MSVRASVTLVLFDLDDTLFDHSYARRCGLRALQDEFPELERIDLDEFVEEHQRQLMASYGRVLEKTVSLERDRLDRFQRLLSIYGMAADEGQASTVEKVFRAAYNDNRRAVPGIKSLLSYLKPKAETGVVTNGLEVTQLEKLSVCRLECLVDFLLTSEEAGIQKPDSGIFVLALERASARAEDAVFVGDSWESDVLGAHGAGLRTVWLNRTGAECPDPDITTEIDAFDPLDRAVKALGL